MTISPLEKKKLCLLLLLEWVSYYSYFIEFYHHHVSVGKNFAFRKSKDSHNLFRDIVLKKTWFEQSLTNTMASKNLVYSLGLR
jgi:hypothetical protein